MEEEDEEEEDNEEADTMEVPKKRAQPERGDQGAVKGTGRKEAPAAQEAKAAQAVVAIAASFGPGADKSTPALTSPPLTSGEAPGTEVQAVGGLNGTTSAGAGGADGLFDGYF